MERLPYAPPEIVELGGVEQLTLAPNFPKFSGGFDGLFNAQGQPVPAHST
jgi:hypothetical protein